MKKRSIFGSKLSLLELIIVLGFFALFSSMCLRVLLTAHRMADENSILINAISTAQNAAECYKANYAPTLYYDEDWNPSEKNNAIYSLVIDSEDSDRISTSSIAVEDKEGKVIFTLHVKDLKEDEQ